MNENTEDEHQGVSLWHRPSRFSADPHGRAAYHPLSRTRCCVVLGNPLASQSNVSLQFHIPQGAERRPFWLEAQMQTAPINHGPSTSAAKPTLAPAAPESCLALPPEPRGLCYLFIFLTPGLSEGFPQRLLLPNFVLSAAEKCS